MVSVLLDAGLIVGWLALTRATNWLIERLGGENAADWDWVAAKYLLGFSTLVAVLIFMFWDLRSAGALSAHGYRDLRRRIEEDEKNEKDDEEGGDDA